MTFIVMDSTLHHLRFGNPDRIEGEFGSGRRAADFT